MLERTILFLLKNQRQTWSPPSSWSRNEKTWNPVLHQDIYGISSLYIQSSICIFSLLFLHTFPKVLTRRVGLTFMSFLSFLYSRDLNVWLRGDIVRRNWMLVILKGPRVKQRVVKYSVCLVFFFHKNEYHSKNSHYPVFCALRISWPLPD